MNYDVRTRLLKQPTVASIGEHSSVIAYPGETNSKLAAYRNPPNVPQMYVWQRYLRPDDLFIDVGANIGIYTIFALDIGAHVVACEPDPHNYQRLTEHVRINGYSAELLNVALADRPGSLRLTQGLDSYNHLVLDGGEGIEVEARTLDDIIGDRHVDGVKVDVEGAERLVLEGAEKALAEKRIALMQIEWSADEVQTTLGERRDRVGALLTAAGYELHRPDSDGRLHHVGPNPESSTVDVFAAPRILSS